MGELLHDYAYAAGLPAHWASIKLLEGDELVERALALPEPVQEQLDRVVAEYESASDLGDRETLVADSRYQYIERVVAASVTKGQKPGELTLSEKVDKVVTGKYLALPLFLCAMLVMFVITSDLHLTIGVSAALAVLQVIVRLCQRQSVMGAVSGLLAVGICLIWAWNSHEARNYYMFGFLTNAFYIVLLAISLMVRVPGLGLVIEFIRTLPTEHLRAWLADWRGDKALNRAYTIITALWIGVFSLRLVVQVPLYLSNQVGWLGTARLLMGIPFWALAIWVSYLIVATPMHRHKTLAEPNADAMDDNNETEEQH